VSDVARLPDPPSRAPVASPDRHRLVTHEREAVESAPATLADRAREVERAMQALTEAGVVPTPPGGTVAAPEPAAPPPARRLRAPIGERIPGEEQPAAPRDPLDGVVRFAHAQERSDAPYRARVKLEADSSPRVFLEPKRNGVDAPGRWLRVGEAFADGWVVARIDGQCVRLLSPAGHLLDASDEGHDGGAR